MLTILSDERDHTSSRIRRQVSGSTWDVYADDIHAKYKSIWLPRTVLTTPQKTLPESERATALGMAFVKAFALVGGERVSK